MVIRFPLGEWIGIYEKAELDIHPEFSAVLSLVHETAIAAKRIANGYPLSIARTTSNPSPSEPYRCMSEPPATWPARAAQSGAVSRPPREPPGAACA
jgi:hypothetical protein